MIRYFLFLSVLFIAGCASLDLGQLFNPQTQKLNPAIYYRNDICFEYEVDSKTTAEARKKGSFAETGWGSSFGSYRFKTRGYNGSGTLEFCGVGVLPYKESYRLRVKSPGKLNFFAMLSCHEEDTTENPDRGIFRRDGTLNIKYKPTLERGMACPLYISAYSKQERHAWGVLAFEHPRYQLDATLQCNGYKTEAHGVSMCQSREGLIQKIEFPEPVKPIAPVIGAADKEHPCPPIGEDGAKAFTFKLPNRECIYGFIGRETGKIHQLYTIGYENIIVRD